MLSLEKLCLDFIVQEFEQFYFIFTVSKDETQQRNLEFLKRKYSGELATKLYLAKRMKNKYLELLINEHLSFLNGVWFEESHRLYSIDDRFRRRDSMEDVFRRLPNLRKFCFRYYCHDEILNSVAKFCPGIVEIDVNYCIAVTDKGVKYLCERDEKIPCPEIKILLIKDCPVTNAGAECLIRKLPKLEKIDFENIPLLLHSIHEKQLHESGKIHLYNLTHLTSNTYYSSNYRPVLKTCFDVCPKLESLNWCISDASQLISYMNSRLKYLTLDCRFCSVTPNIANTLKVYGSNLSYLNISYCSISISSLNAYCPLLNKFDGSFVIFTNDSDKEDIEKLKFEFLKDFRFQGIDPPSQEGICLLLSSSPKLESLTFDYLNFSLQLKTHILLWCRNHFLKKIVFESVYVDVEMEFIRNILLKCPSLNEMSLSNCLYMGSNSELHKYEQTIRDLANYLLNKPKLDPFDFYTVNAKVI